MKILIVGLIAVGLPARADDFVEPFDNVYSTCVAASSDPGFSIWVAGGRCHGSMEPRAGNGAALAWTEFSAVGDFEATVEVARESLGRYGTMGMLVLFDDGQFINIYFRGRGDICAVNSINGRSGYTAESAPSAVFRLARTAETISYGYDPGDGYRSLGDDPVPSATRPGRIYLFLTNYLNERAALRGTFDEWSVSADDFMDASCLCPADLNGDGQVDLLDFGEFLRAYAHDEPAADIAAPYGLINGFDVLAFQSAFGNGC